MKVSGMKVVGTFLTAFLLFLMSNSGTIAGKSTIFRDYSFFPSPRGYIDGTSGKPVTARYRSGQVLVKFKDGRKGRPRGLSLVRLGAKSVSDIGGTGLSLVTLKKGVPVVDAVKGFRKNGSVLYAEPNYLRFLLGVPNDPKFPRQWGLKRMSATQAWDVQGHNATTVAVLDTGVQSDHADLKANLVKGRHFWVNSKGLLKEDGDYSDDDGHGTHVSGIVAASANNGIGVAGVSPYTKIMPIKVEGEYGIDDASIAAGMKYAVDHGAQIINMSLSGPDKSEVLADGVSYAYSKKCTVVAAAGNSGDLTLREYPAAADHVIAVGATDWTADGTTEEKIAPFSTSGNFVDVCAPGVRILSTYPSQSYSYEDGTSMASPAVAGVAALIKSKIPSADPDYIENVLEWTAIDLGDPGKDRFFGYGRVDAYEALREADPKDRYEPNDLPVQAIHVHVGNPVLSTLTGSEDVDWFVLGVDRSATLSVSLSFMSSNSADVEVYDSAGSVRLNDADISATSAEVFLPARGPYLVRIFHNAQTVYPCNYRLNLSSTLIKPESTIRDVYLRFTALGMPLNMVAGQASSGSQVKINLLKSNGAVLESQTVDTILNGFYSERFKTPLSSVSKIEVTDLGNGDAVLQDVLPVTAKGKASSDMCFGTTLPEQDVLIDVEAESSDFGIEREIVADASGNFSLGLGSLTDLLIGDSLSVSVFDSKTGNGFISKAKVPGLYLDLGDCEINGYLDDKTIDKIFLEFWRGNELKARVGMTRSFDSSLFGCKSGAKRNQNKKPAKSVSPIYFSAALPDGSFYVVFRPGFVRPLDRISVKTTGSKRSLISFSNPLINADANFIRDLVVGKTVPNRNVMVLLKRSGDDGSGEGEGGDNGIAKASSNSFLNDFTCGGEKGAARTAKSGRTGRFTANFKSLFNVRGFDDMRLIYFDPCENFVSVDETLTGLVVFLVKCDPVLFSPIPASPHKKDVARISFISSKKGEAKLTLRNSKGVYVNLLRKSIARGVNFFVWNGRNSRGKTVPSGGYRCRLSVKDDVGNFDTASGMVFVDTVRPRILEMIAKPNPFLPYPDGRKDFVRVNFRLSESCSVIAKIKDIKGKVVKIFRMNGRTGWNYFKWSGVNSKSFLSPVGNYRVNLYITDKAGNSNWTSLFPVELYM